MASPALNLAGPHFRQLAASHSHTCMCMSVLPRPSQTLPLSEPLHSTWEGTPSAPSRWGRYAATFMVSCV